MLEDRPTILVVDDDSRIRKLCGILLRNVGKVVEAEDPREALGHLDEVDFVLTDLHMPKMTGRALVEEVRHRCPETPVLMMTGSDDADPELLLAQESGIPILRKPFRLQELTRAVLSLIGRRPLQAF